MTLAQFWFILITVLWTGFFVLLYAAIGTVDLLLMVKYSRQPLPPARAGAGADAPVPAVQY